MDPDVLRYAHDLKAAALVAVVLESFLEAVYICVFVVCVHHQRRHEQKVNRIVFATSVLLLCLVTVRWILGVIKSYRAFTNDGTSVMGPVAEYLGAGSPLYIARIILYMGCSALINLLLIYRLFVLMERRYTIVLIPLLTECGAIVCYCVMIPTLTQTSIQDVIRDGYLKPRLIAAYAFVCSTSCYASSIIAYRILKDFWWIRKSGLRASLLVYAASTIVEAAFLYNLLGIAVVVLYIMQSPYLYIVMCINPACMGINFTLILLRISVLSEKCHGAGMNVSVPRSAAGHTITFETESGTAGTGKDIPSIRVFGARCAEHSLAQSRV